jgi:phosphohistidine phosphatase
MTHALIVFRHSKSDWSADYGGSDMDRPLAKRGRKAAKLAGRFLADSGEVPDAVICSPALRSRATLALACEARDWELSMRESDALYDDGVEGLIGEVRREPESTRLLMVVGHEPACSATVSFLIGGGAVRMPTAALARIDLLVDEWAELGPGTGVLSWLVVPPGDRGIGHSHCLKRAGDTERTRTSSFSRPRGTSGSPGRLEASLAYSFH